uniref:U6 snRNA phosphodiesterase 1 n=1 Tax=Pelodiscus sinensis TaxID=13735 RepID=K7F978_PELSI
RLPVPDSVLNMFRDQEEEFTDDNTKHGGRVRNFPHERGNWATYVYLPCKIQEGVLELVELLVSHCRRYTVSLTAMEEFHISLSQCVVLRYHWINPLIQSLKERIAPFNREQRSPGTQVFLRSLCRTFVGLEVSCGHSQLLDLASEVDKVMEEFDLPTFYKVMSRFLSAILSPPLQNLQASAHWCVFQGIADGFEDSAFPLRFQGDQIGCKSGNKFFSFPLK